MNKVPLSLEKHVKEFISQTRERLSCNGCNDWDLTGEQLEIARGFLGDPEAENSDYTVLAVIKKALGL